MINNMLPAVPPTDVTMLAEYYSMISGITALILGLLFLLGGIIYFCWSSKTPPNDSAKDIGSHGQNHTLTRREQKELYRLIRNGTERSLMLYLDAMHTYNKLNEATIKHHTKARERE